MSRRRKSYRSKNIRQIAEPESSTATEVKQFLATIHEPPPPPPTRFYHNDRELTMPTETKLEIRSPKTIPILQIGVATLGVSIDFTQDIEGSYQKWRFTWTACAFGWRTGGILYPRSDLRKS